MTDRPDPLGAAAFGNSAFPESAPPKGSTAWQDFRAKNAAASSWDSAIAKVNAEFGFAPPAPASGGARADAGWSAPAASAPAAAPSAGGAAHPGSSAGFPISPMARLSSPEMIAAKLPGLGAARYVALGEKKDEWFLLGRAVFDQISEKQTERQKAQIRIREISQLDRYAVEPKVVLEDPEYKIAVTKVDNLTAEIARLEARRAPWVSKANCVGHVLNAVDRYLSEARLENIKEWSMPLKLAKADTVPAVLDRIALLKADLLDAETRPWPAADAKRRAIEEIEFLAAKGKVDVSKSVDYRNQLGWPLSSADITLRGYGKRDARGMPDLYNEHTVSPDVALVCWLFKDTVIARITAEIDEMGNDERALSEEQRGAQIARVNGNILAEQRLLSQIIWAGELHDQWPADTDPRAVLGIDGPALRQD